MSIDLLARKGEACPAATHPGGESRFQARRIVVLPSLALHRAASLPSTSVPARPATLLPRRSDRSARKKFTFRIEPDRHHRFCEAAAALGVSRQKLLTDALDAHLEQLRPGTAAENRPHR